MPMRVAGVNANPTRAYTPRVTMRLLSRPSMAVTDIFHSRKYAQMSSMTSTRKTTRAWTAFLVIWLPH